jgi:hypothetical protein
VEKNKRESRRARFVRLANKRVNAAIKAISLVGNLSNRANYDYTPEDAAAIVKALEKELRELRSRFGSSERAAEGEFRLSP